MARRVPLKVTQKWEHNRLTIEALKSTDIIPASND